MKEYRFLYSMAYDFISRLVEALADLQESAHNLRCDVLKMYYRAGWGHIASAFSCTEILTAVYFGGEYMEGRDHVVLSKGHGCAAQYAALARMGKISREELATFYQPGARLTGLASSAVPGIDAPTGSLGMGLGFAVGQALAAERYNVDAHMYVILGDGEIQEGAVWEAAMMAGNEHLSSLTAIVDCNGLQASGFVADIAPINPLPAKWESFGWHVLKADGHDVGDLQKALAEARREKARPTVVLAKTIKGYGFPAAEGRAEWHSRRPTAEEWSEAAAFLGMRQEELMKI